MSILHKAFKKGARWGKRFLNPPKLILLYHRVTELETDPQLLSVAPENFRQQMQILSRKFQMVPLKEIANPQTSNRAQCAITFDDGYADNYIIAKPILEEFGIPATFFITASFVGSNREFWWDELEKIFLLPGSLPEQLHCSINGDYLDLKLSDSGEYSVDNFCKLKQWNVTMKNFPQRRHQVYAELCTRIRALPDEQRLQIIDALFHQANISPSARNTHRSLSINELVQLSSAGLFEVGAHSYTHSVLAGLSPSRQQQEIKQSKQKLCEMTGKQIDSFAYPYGTQADFSAGTMDILREAGFQRACVSFPGFVTAHSDVFQLPRYLVRNWTGQELKAVLNKWLYE